MAPKKYFLILTVLILITGLATANSFKDSPEDEVWLNQDSPEIDFLVEYSSECVSDNTTEIVYDGDVVETFDDSEKFEEREDSENEEYGDLIGYRYNFSDFDDSGSYSIEVSCDAEEEVSEEDEPETAEEILEAGNLMFELEDVPSDTLYEGDSFEASTALESDNNELSVPEIGFEYRFNEEEWGSLTVEDNSFELSIDSSEIESLDVKADAGDFNLEDSADLDVKGVWQIEGLSISADDSISDKTVKYRNLDQLQIEFTVTERGEGVPGLRTDEFLFDGEDDWFEKEDLGSGDYRLNIDGRPVYSDLRVENPIDVDIEVDDRVDIVELRIEEDVEFSGRVLDVRNNRVDTGFTIEHDGRVRSFETDSDGFFEEYIETDTVDMRMDFPEARVNLDNMQVNREEAGDLSYNYYDDVEESVETGDMPNVRPVNLAAFISNYHFDEGINSNIRMEFDTSEIDPDQIEVYECVQWTFRSETCDGEWNEIDDNDVGLTPGATWKADFPITPRESERFGHDDGVLTNAYLIGIPEGVGSGLALESSLDVSSSRVVSGDQLTISGNVIDDSTGDPVENVDVELSLESSDNSLTESAYTDEGGEFELVFEIEEADLYDVEFSAEKSPFESFSQRESEAIEVYYETGLSVTSESDPEIGLGQDYDIVYTVENVGQTDAEDIEMSVSGVDDYSLEPDEISNLESDESVEVVLTINLPEDTRTPPSITFEVDGLSSGDDITGSASTMASFHDDVTFEEQTTDSSENTGESTDTQESRSYPDSTEVRQMTGEFIESQSQMNLALGLILVFAAVLAVAVKNKDKDSSRDMRGRGQSRVQAPQVVPQDEENSDKLDDEKKEDSGSQSSEGSASDDSGSESEVDTDRVVCDVCGEKFDTESGMNLHKQALH